MACVGWIIADLFFGGFVSLHTCTPVQGVYVRVCVCCVFHFLMCFGRRKGDALVSGCVLNA